MAKPKSRRALLLGAGGVIVVGAIGMALLVPRRAANATAITVYKDPFCTCCQAWANHLAANGFTVHVEVRSDLAELRRLLGVPGDLTSCHSAATAKYVIEGHVPAADIKRLLTEQPSILGLAVPGMPVGSPGMEVLGQSDGRYNVMAFKRDGTRFVFRSYPG